MVAPKGKPATKGAKQIVDENAATLIFYRNMGLGATAIYCLIMFIFFFESITGGIIALFCLSSAIYQICFHLMRFAAKPTYSESGQLSDTGTDLNMEGGIAEHVKDLIILTAGTQLLSLVTNYFWLLLLLAPIRAMFMLWKSVLSPWFFQDSSPQQPLDEKKQRKLDRKMKMQNN